MAITTVVGRVRMVQYDGSNSTDVLSLYTASFTAAGNAYTASVFSATGSAVVIRVLNGSGHLQYDETTALNQWVIQAGAAIRAGVATADQAESVTGLAELTTAMAASVPGFAHAVSAVSGATGIAVNITAAANTTTNTDITLYPAFASTSYTAHVIRVQPVSAATNVTFGNVTNGVLQNAGKISGSVVRVALVNSHPSTAESVYILVIAIP